MIMEQECKAPKPMLTDEAFEQVAGFFKVLSEPLRLKILQALYEGERTVNQIMEATEGNQANVSKHLRVLLDAGLLSRRKEGTNAYYRIADPLVFSLCDSVCVRQQAYLEAQASHFKDRVS